MSSLIEYRMDILDLLDRTYKRDKDGRFGSGGGGGASGQEALDAVPAKLTRPPRGHYGDYAGEKLDGPPGMGSARALSEYEGVEYQNVNSYLREGSAASRGYTDEFDRQYDTENAARVSEIDKTMGASKLQSDVEVSRVIKEGASVFGDTWHGDTVNWNDMEHGTDRWAAGERPNLTGASWHEKGYSSTTADPKVAPEFGGRWAKMAKESPGDLDGEPVIMKMHVPAGSGAVQLSEMGHAAEILLDRNSTYTVTADHGVAADGFRYLDVEVSYG